MNTQHHYCRFLLGDGPKYATCTYEIAKIQVAFKYNRDSHPRSCWALIVTEKVGALIRMEVSERGETSVPATQENKTVVGILTQDQGIVGLGVDGLNKLSKTVSHYTLLDMSYETSGISNYHLSLKKYGRYPYPERYHLDVDLFIDIDVFFRVLQVRKPFNNMLYMIGRVNKMKRESFLEVMHPESISGVLPTEAFYKQIKHACRYSLAYEERDDMIREKLGLRLFKYQVENVKFMQDLEDEALSARYAIIEGGKKVRGYDLYHHNNSLMLSKSPPKTMVAMRGGAIMDEVGLGKTATTIGLIYHTYNRFPSKKVDDMEKFPLVTWRYKPMTYPLPDEAFVSSNKYIETEATLVITRNGLTEQWRAEYVRMTGENPIVICDVMDLSKLSYRDLLKAPMVVVSQSLFDNLFWVASFLGSHKSWNDGSFYRMMLIKDNVICGNASLDELFPYLYAFLWERVVLDEGHEIFQTERRHVSRNVHLTLSLPSKYFWYVSGTVPDLVKFPPILLEHLAHTEGRPLEIQFLTKRMLKLFRRNTRESIKNETALVDVVEVVRSVEFTPTEMASYNHLKKAVFSDKFNEEIRQFCTCPFISRTFESAANLDDIPKVVLKEAYVRLERLEERLRLLNASLAHNESELALETSTQERANIRQRIRSAKNSIEETEKQISELREKNSYYHSVVDKIMKLSEMKEGDEEDEELNCPICMEVFEGPTLTPCSHLFCYRCIVAHLEYRKNCPFCKAPIEGEKNLTKISMVKNVPKDNKPDLRQSYGSKVALLISDIKEKLEESPDNRIIVFSQWEVLLTRVMDLLKVEGIEVMQCKGNHRMVKNAVREFKQSSKYRVIMLSSEKSSTGLNLTEANMVFIIDPIRAPTPRQAYDIEQQAIGRSRRLGQKHPIIVHRYVVKDTVEEEIYREQREFQKRSAQELGLPAMSNVLE